MLQKRFVSKKARLCKSSHFYERCFPVCSGNATYLDCVKAKKRALYSIFKWTYTIYTDIAIYPFTENSDIHWR